MGLIRDLILSKMNEGKNEEAFKQKLAIQEALHQKHRQESFSDQLKLMEIRNKQQESTWKAHNEIQQQNHKENTTFDSGLTLKRGIQLQDHRAALDAKLHKQKQAQAQEDNYVTKKFEDIGKKLPQLQGILNQISPQDQRAYLLNSLPLEEINKKYQLGFTPDQLNNLEGNGAKATKPAPEVPTSRFLNKYGNADPATGKPKEQPKPAAKPIMESAPQPTENPSGSGMESASPDQARPVADQEPLNWHNQPSQVEAPPEPLNWNSPQEAPQAPQEVQPAAPQQPYSPAHMTAEQNQQGLENLKSFGYGAAKGAFQTLAAVPQTALNVGQHLGLVSPETTQKYTQGVDQMIQNRDQAHPDLAKSGYATAGNVAAQAAPFVAAGPATLAGKVGLGMAGGATTYQPEGQGGIFSDNTANSIAMGTLGAVAHGLGKVISPIYNRMTKSGGTADALKALGQSELAPLGEAASAVKTLNNKDIFLTSAEAAPGALIKKLSTKLSLSKSNILKFESMLTNRVKAVNQTIDNLMSDVLKGQPLDVVQAKSSDLLQSIQNKAVPKKALTLLGNDDNIMKSFETVLKNPAYTNEFKNKFSYGMAQAVKDHLEGLAQKYFDAGQGLAGESVRKSIKLLNNTLGAENEAWATGNKLAQSYKIVNKYKTLLDQVKLGPAQSAPTMQQTYNTIFSSNERYGQFVRDLDQAGVMTGPGSTVDALRTVLNRIYGAKTEKLLSQKGSPMLSGLGQAAIGGSVGTGLSFAAGERDPTALGLAGAAGIAAVGGGVRAINNRYGAGLLEAIVTPKLNRAMGQILKNQKLTDIDKFMKVTNFLQKAVITGNKASANKRNK